MGKTIMGVAAVSLDGFIADDRDDVGPLSSTGSTPVTSAGRCGAATARPAAPGPPPSS